MSKPAELPQPARALRPMRVMGVLAALALAAAFLWHARATALRAERRSACATGDRAACEAICSRDEAGACAQLGDLTSDAAPERARGAYRFACEAHETNACRKLGRLLETGRGGSPDPAGAALEYRGACDTKDTEACGRLGLLTRTGTGVARDDGAAAPLLDRGCAGGLGEACFALAEMADKGEGVEKNGSRAAVAYARGCAAEEPRSCLWLAQHAASGVDATEALTPVVGAYVKRACLDHDAPGCADAIYGDDPLSLDGLDPGERGKLELRTCDVPDARACAKAGSHALNDAVLPLDYAQAIDRLTRACNADPKQGCVELANVYDKGQGTPKDPARAAQLARRSCGDAATHLEKGWSCPKAPVLRQGRAVFNGQVTFDVFQRVLSMASSGFPACWQSRGITSVNGKVAVHMVIGRDGKVPLAQVTSFENVDAITANCVVSLVRELRFPEPSGGAVTLNFPLALDYGGP